MAVCGPGPALGMFEVFGQTGPLILGGHQAYSALQSPDPRKTYKFTQQTWRSKML